MIDRKYPLPNDPRLKSILESIYNFLDGLERRVNEQPKALSPKDIQSVTDQVRSGLLGVFGVPVIGQGSDPALQNLGGGTVINFSAGDLSPLFTTNEATTTTTPALTFSQIAQAANIVFAGPTSGTPAAPTFRGLVAADLPVAAVQSTGSKIIAAAPYTNDGYVVALVNGVSVKLMTTA